MARFRLDNGKDGVEKAWHTATGYECIANHPGNSRGYAERIHFYVKHVVGSDGRPYAEVGLTGLEEGEKSGTLQQVKQLLEKAGIRNIPSLTYVDEDEMAYAEQLTADYSSIAVRLHAGQDSVSLAVDALNQFILDISREFVKEQEQVPNVIYESILEVMGPELDKGPGGHDHAIEYAKRVSEELIHGIQLPMTANQG